MLIEQTNLGHSTAAMALTKPVAVIVEDDPLVAMIGEESLRDIGYAPIVASTATAAMALFQGRTAPVLAVIDVGLPDGRGDALAWRLRALHADLRIIIASGYDEGELRMKFADDPSITVLAKPYTEEDLVSALRALGADFTAP